MAQAVGKSRSVIANLLRLLSLEPEVRQMLTDGALDTGHGKVLLALEGPAQLRAAREVARKKLSVRQTEALVKSTLAPTPADSPRVDPDIDRLQRDLSARLGAGVTINHASNGRGKLVISYSNLDELDGILKHIS